MIWGTHSAARDLSRLREISSVLIRHGLGDLVRRTGLATALERAGQILHWGEAGKSAEIEPQERFRRSLEELGPTFVKLGQVLSTRPDLLSPSWIAELERLHSDVAPVSFDELLPQIEKGLGRSPFDVFADVEREPHAAASIAQVHRAKLPSGASVVLKIRRPGISAKIAADLRLLDHLANLIEHEMPEARRYAPVQVVAQFRRSLERELDLAVEARNVDRFSRNFADDPHIVIPKVYWDFTSWSRKTSATSRAGRATSAWLGRRLLRLWPRRQQPIERAGDRAQHVGGDVRVARRRLQLGVPEQHLDHAHVDVVLQQVRGKAVPQRVRRHPGAQARRFRRHVANAVELPCRDRQQRIAVREQPALRAALQPPRAQQLEQLRREHRMPVLLALALLDADQHALGVDVTDPQSWRVFSPNLRTAMSSSMRRRRSLTGACHSSGAPFLRLKVANPSILKTERPPRHPLPISQLPRRSPQNSILRAALSRVGGFVP